MKFDFFPQLQQLILNKVQQIHQEFVPSPQGQESDEFQDAEEYADTGAPRGDFHFAVDEIDKYLSRLESLQVDFKDTDDFTQDLHTEKLNGAIKKIEEIKAICQDCHNIANQIYDECNFTELSLLFVDEHIDYQNYLYNLRVAIILVDKFSKVLFSSDLWSKDDTTAILSCFDTKSSYLFENLKKQLKYGENKNLGMNRLENIKEMLKNSCDNLARVCEKTVQASKYMAAGSVFASCSLPMSNLLTGGAAGVVAGLGFQEITTEFNDYYAKFFSEEGAKKGSFASRYTDEHFTAISSNLSNIFPDSSFVSKLHEYLVSRIKFFDAICMNSGGMTKDDIHTIQNQHKSLLYFWKKIVAPQASREDILDNLIRMLQIIGSLHLAKLDEYNIALISSLSHNNENEVVKVVLSMFTNLAAEHVLPLKTLEKLCNQIMQQSIEHKADKNLQSLSNSGRSSNLQLAPLNRKHQVSFDLVFGQCFGVNNCFITKNLFTIDLWVDAIITSKKNSKIGDISVELYNSITNAELDVDGNTFMHLLANSYDITILQHLSNVLIREGINLHDLGVDLNKQNSQNQTFIGCLINKFRTIEMADEEKLKFVNLFSKLMSNIYTKDELSSLNIDEYTLRFIHPKEKFVTTSLKSLRKVVNGMSSLSSGSASTTTSLLALTRDGGCLDAIEEDESDWEEVEVTHSDLLSEDISQITLTTHEDVVNLIYNKLSTYQLAVIIKLEEFFEENQEQATLLRNFIAEANLCVEIGNNQSRISFVHWLLNLQNGEFFADIVRLIFDKNKDSQFEFFNRAGPDGGCLLLHLAREKDINKLDRIISHFTTSRGNTKSVPFSLTQQDKDGNTLLHILAKYSDEASVNLSRKLLENSGYLRKSGIYKSMLAIKNNQGNTPVHIIAEAGNQLCWNKVKDFSSGLVDTACSLVSSSSSWMPGLSRFSSNKTTTPDVLKILSSKNSQNKTPFEVASDGSTIKQLISDFMKANRMQVTGETSRVFSAPSLG